MDIMDEIYQRQQTMVVTPARHAPPKHQPEMLYIGCVDARLDPIDDIGIAKGKALIFRNIAALVPKYQPAAAGRDHGTFSSGGRPPREASVGAALEFFLNHIPAKGGRIKHIVVSGHSDCGGLQACRRGRFGVGDHDLPLYLENLAEALDKVTAEAEAGGWDEARMLHELEEESVRQSVANLRGFPAVASAVKEGRLKLHGWVINTASQRISEMDPETLRFESLGAKL
jgi:carbonic anhydrase